MGKNLHVISTKNHRLRATAPILVVCTIQLAACSQDLSLGDEFGSAQTGADESGLICSHQDPEGDEAMAVCTWWSKVIAQRGYRKPPGMSDEELEASCGCYDKNTYFDGHGSCVPKNALCNAPNSNRTFSSGGSSDPSCTEPTLDTATEEYCNENECSCPDDHWITSGNIFSYYFCTPKSARCR